MNALLDDKESEATVGGEDQEGKDRHPSSAPTTNPNPIKLPGNNVSREARAKDTRLERGTKKAEPQDSERKHF